MYSQGNLQKLFAYFFHALSKSASSLVSITNETNLFSKDLIFDYLKSTHGFFESLLIKKCWKLFTKTRLYLWPGAREKSILKAHFFVLLLCWYLKNAFSLASAMYFFRGYRKRPVAWNTLRDFNRNSEINTYLSILCNNRGLGQEDNCISAWAGLIQFHWCEKFSWTFGKFKWSYIKNKQEGFKLGYAVFKNQQRKLIKDLTKEKKNIKRAFESIAGKYFKAI